MNRLLFQLEFKGNNGKKYKVKATPDSVVYAKESEGDYLLGFY